MSETTVQAAVLTLSLIPSIEGGEVDVVTLKYVLHLSNKTWSGNAGMGESAFALDDDKALGEAAAKLLAETQRVLDENMGLAREDFALIEPPLTDDDDEEL